MKVLVATIETQGRRKNDFSYALPDELVTFGSECSREAVDGKCGCRRSMAGVKTRRATTTVKVVDQEVTVAELEVTFADSLIAAGWFQSRDRDAALAAARDDVREVCRIADAFPNGTVLEKRGNKFIARTGISVPSASKLH